MKIDSSIKPVGATNVGEARGRTTAKPAAGVLGNGVSDVRLSGLSAQLQLGGDTPAFDAGRVSEIKQAIAEGRFTINAGAIADRLISSAKELANPQRQA